MLLESIKMSWENIINNKLRSFLTMLGIVIGVASIIALITTVQGATDSISEEVNSLGVNKITVNVSGTPMKKGLNNENLNDINALDNVKYVSPTVSGPATIVYNHVANNEATVQGNNEVYFKTNDSALSSGRAINPLDIRDRTKVTVIGSNIVDELFYGNNPIGQTIKINGVSYEVIGTLSSSREFGVSSNNDTVVVPYTTALRSMGLKDVTSLDVYVENSDLASDSVQDIKNTLHTAFNYNEDAYNVFNMGSLIDAFDSMMDTMSLLLAGIAAISLIVGGIGIMNMMLVSITERTTEIGLRKALGATPARIQLQFIIESIFLSIIGGLIGLLIGAGIAYIASILIDINFAISASTVILAVGFSAAVGIVFGFAPARKASKLNPIDALRSL